jgi:hypothetical protein
MPVEASGFHTNKNVEQNSNLLFLKKGVTQLRVLPAYGSHGRWFREIKEIPLYINGRYSPQVSPATDGKPCPFMMEGQRLYNLGGEENVEKAKKFRPRSSFLFNVVVQSSPDGNVDINSCVKVLKCGVKVFRQILDLDQDVAGGWGDVTNLANGIDLRITRTGEGRNNTEYAVKGIPGRSDILEWLEKGSFSQELQPYNLNDMFAPANFEDLEEHLIQFKDENDGSGEVENSTRPTFDQQVSEARPEAPIKGEGIEVPPLPTE